MSEPQRRGSGDTRQKILVATIELLAEHGTTGTGLNQIAKRSGVSYGSVYNQFRDGKDALIAAAIEQACRELIGTLQPIFELSDSLTAACKLYFDYGAGLLENSDYTRGCAVGTAASDGHSIPSVNAAAHECFTLWEDFLADNAIRFGAKPGDASRFASTALSLYQGSLLIGRVRRSTAQVEQAGAIACELAAEVAPK